MPRSTCHGPSAPGDFDPEWLRKMMTMTMTMAMIRNDDDDDDNDDEEICDDDVFLS